MLETCKDITHSIGNSVRNGLVCWNAASNAKMLENIEQLGGVDKVKADKDKARDIQNELLR